jgi:hypothetical protein
MRAFTGSADILGASPYITQPTVGRKRIGQAERDMAWGLGALFIISIGLAYLGVYLNLPEDEKPYAAASPMAYLIEQTLRKPKMEKVNFETYIGYEVGSPMMYDAKAALGLREVEKVMAAVPPATGKRKVVAEETPVEEPAAAPEPKKPVPVAEVEAVPVPAPKPAPVEVAALAPAEKAVPSPGKDSSETARVQVVDRSIVSEKPPKLAKAGCSEGGNKDDCARHVVTFRRNWGPVLEERVYSSEEMSQRARELWQREGKILEPNGGINESYVVKPKAFTPIPGHPA